jgi:small-conductance mechanosensitive channel
MLETLTNQIVVRMEIIAESIVNWVLSHGLNIAVILGAAWLIRRVGDQLLDRFLVHVVRPEVYPTKSDREKRIRTLHSLASGILRGAVYIITTILLIGEVKPGSTTLLFTSAGVVGVVVGFGAQSLIRDLVSGIFIIIENQYRIGDEIVLASGAGLGTIDGTVEDVTIRTTVLRDLSGNVHHIPNGNIGRTTNRTLGFSKMNEVLVVSMDTDLEKLEKIIQKAGEDLTKIDGIGNKILEAPYLASVNGFTDKGVAVRILAKTSAAAQWKIRSEFFRILQQGFEKNNIKLVGQKDEQTD